MASKEIQRMFLRGITPSEQPPEETKKLVTNGDLLIKIKHIYDSWPYEDISLATVINMHRNNNKKSLIIKDSEKLDEVKEVAKKILQEHKLKASTVYDLGYARGYKEETLRRFGDNSDLKNYLLEEIFKKYPGMDPESQQKREELVMEAINNGTAFRKKDDTWHETSQHTFARFQEISSQQNISKTTTIVIPEVKTNQPTTISIEIGETPIIKDTLFNQKPLSERFEIIRNIKKEYQMGGKNNRSIPFLIAAQSVFQPSSSFSEEITKSLRNWFDLYLPGFGINNIKDLDYETICSFSNANPNIITYFDNQESENKLGETAFRIITNELVGHYQKLQLFVSQFLLTIPLENRLDYRNLQDFIKKCKTGFNFDANSEEQIKRISRIYPTASSTSEFIAKLFQ